MNQKQLLSTKTGIEVIGLNKYNFLRSLPQEQLTDEQKEQIRRYEEKGVDIEKANKALQTYEKKLREPIYQKEIKVSKKQILGGFWAVYEQMNGRKFEENEKTLQNLKVLITYFAKDELFFKCENVHKISKPSLDKGLLIIGGYGNGKTSTMKAFEKLLFGIPGYSFKTYSANEVVVDFEKCTGQYQEELRADFERRMFKQRIYFDDVKTERIASNYGKVNIFKEILEERSLHKTKTFMSCNFKEGFEGNIEKAIEEFGEKYGGRIYDRIFEMFNVVHFKGGSFRK